MEFIWPDSSKRSNFELIGENWLVPKGLMETRFNFSSIMNTKTKDIRVPPYLYLTMFSATDPVSSSGGSDGGGGGTNNPQGGLDTTTTIIIAVVVSIIVLIISGAVIAFVCHRRRRRGNKGGLPRGRGAKDNTYAEKVQLKNRKPHPSPRPESSQSVRETGEFKGTNGRQKTLWDLPCLLHLLFWFHVSNYHNFWNNERWKSCIKYFSIIKLFRLQKPLSKWR